MVGLGFFFIGLTLLAACYRWRGRLYETRWLLWIFVPAVVLPILANELGWVAAEVGRQPWIVHPPVEWTADGSDLVVGTDGLVAYDAREGLRTVDAVSPNVRAGQVLGSSLGFGAIYVALGAVWLFVLDRKIKQGPQPPGEQEPSRGDGLLGATGRRVLHEDRMTGGGGTGGETS
jgi:cytochrome d ubiquinol oxidase subunit I